LPKYGAKGWSGSDETAPLFLLHFSMVLVVQDRLPEAPAVKPTVTVTPDNGA
jgi:hypothetical protein